MKLVVTNKTIAVNDSNFQCAIGKNGLSRNKVEGDLCTPVGIFKFNKIYYRKDKLGEIDFKLPFEAINKKSGWCDDKNSRLYNQYIEFPFEESAEQLHRTDDIYDIVCVINYNTDPIVAGKGSAIFLHVCRDDFSGTEGCIAMEKNQLLDIAKKISVSSTIEIKN